MTKKNSASLGFDTFLLEGALFVPDLLEKAARGELAHQKEADYSIPKGRRLLDEYGRAFQIGEAQWREFRTQRARTDVDTGTATIPFVTEFLHDVLDYAEIEPAGHITVGERTYPVALMAGQHVPVVVAPHALDLDDPDPRFAVEGAGARKKSAFQVAQEFLNARPDCIWGFVTNGRRLRLLRDSTTLTRPSFLEIDFERIFEEDRYADFTALWRLLHASRAASDPCVWEQWRAEGQAQGSRVREGLRVGVTEALIALGEGFLKYPGNNGLREQLSQGTLKKEELFQQLLRLVYRFIFLFTVEDRGLLHSPRASEEARHVYAEGYAAARLRDRALRRVGYDHYGDLWQGLRIVWRALAHGEPRLGLPALGGVFAESQCAALDACQIDNHHLLTAVRELAWFASGQALVRVDYRNMGPEELGSIYESLLELVPVVDVHARHFGFVGITEEGATQGHTRKTTGSYYTPDGLVQELVKSALEPVIEERLKSRSDNPVEALLSINVVDPACGSGHFLLAAARRLAERLAAVRTPDGAVRPDDYRRALRDVITHCVFGVDRNPMALELARIALWLEAVDPERPLGFLDHHLVCGDALLGVTDLKQLLHGIPDAAFKPLSGDSKEVCKQLTKENKEGLKAFAKHRANPNLQLALEKPDALAHLAALEGLPDATPEQVAAKEQAYVQFLNKAKESRLAQAADLFVSAFLATKDSDTALKTTPTSKTLFLELHTDHAPNTEDLVRLQTARQLCEQSRVLHWPLAFAQVFTKGGFDVVLGNPPWDMLQLDPQEFFAVEAPNIANARHMAARNELIAELKVVNPALYAKYLHALHDVEAMQCFVHDSGRFTYAGFGRVNLSSLFAETTYQIFAETGRTGLVLPSGISTDSFTQHLFNKLSERLVSLFDFENREAIFPSVHRSYKFCLMTLGQSPNARFAFFLTQTEQLADERRQFTLAPEDFHLINPNTRTCPVFRSQRDAELTKKIYRYAPVLIEESSGEKPERNCWGIRFMLMFMMNTDSNLFEIEDGSGHLPLYEGKMIHQFDHRWASYGSNDGDEDAAQDVPLADKRNPTFTVRPRYWVEAREVYLRAAKLPKVLLDALGERNSAGIVLGMIWLLFGKWLQQKGVTSASKAMLVLYPTWCEFEKRYPFAQSFAPTQLSLYGDNPACLEPKGPEYLSTIPVNQIKNSDRHRTAWHAADEKAVAAYLDAVSRLEFELDVVPALNTEADVLALAEEYLEQASPKWFIGFRDITNATNERTVISSVLPRAGVGNNLPLLIFDVPMKANYYAALLGNFCTLPLDFVARHKVGGTHLNFFIAKQLPVLRPDRYTKADLDFIVPRVLELTYTAHDLKPWAEDLDYFGPPFSFDPDRRALLRAELDAYYAKLYGLTRDELRYMLDPADVMGPGYPSETFRVLKNNEEKEFGEYRTRRLVLEAWDRLP